MKKTRESTILNEVNYALTDFNNQMTIINKYYEGFSYNNQKKRESEKMNFTNYEECKTRLPKAIKHEEICKAMTDLYERKNHDYGDSFAIMRNEYDNAILIRLFDKYSRLKTLKAGNVAQVKEESIKDTLFDLANYCIMELVEMEFDNDDEIQ